MVELGKLLGVVQAEMPRIHGAERLRGVKVDLNERRNGPGRELDVGQIKLSGGATVSQLAV